MCTSGLITHAVRRSTPLIHVNGRTNDRMIKFDHIYYQRRQRSAEPNLSFLQKVI